MQIQKCIDLHMDRQTLCFTVAFFLQYEKQYTFSKKTRTKIGDTQGTWRLPSSPIVGKSIRFSYVNCESGCEDDDDDEDYDDVDEDDDVDDDDAGGGEELTLKSSNPNRRVGNNERLKK